MAWRPASAGGPSGNAHRTSHMLIPVNQKSTNSRPVIRQIHTTIQCIVPKRQIVMPIKFRFEHLH
jgi:hypothetical protein